ncbi:hypothetical protein [Hymenobacter terrenus]|uniref:hypothetical protein n=1 Tax=Hymenobacter terrenus TaxID=1629124 RepID=UPI000B33741B|nr:hypothetical protein [Hymenobacter terrenus]
MRFSNRISLLFFLGPNVGLNSCNKKVVDPEPLSTPTTVTGTATLRTGTMFPGRSAEQRHGSD